jgi:tRNA(fMet)-specific endonuclease VapC
VRRYLLDTGIAGDYADDRRGVRARVRQEIARGNRVGICDPVLGELDFGVENSDTRDKNLPKLVRAVNELRVWPYTSAAAREYGRLAALLLRAGRWMQQIDIQIAAIALTLGNCTVVSSDSDLSAVPGLDVENWATP